ncbi:MAG: hypothetical protein K2M56_00165 [Muribaculaceae bacterium]|nr:hypothetical protein [Muribaculaceae bacterium]
MKRLFQILMAVTLAFIVVSCSKGEDKTKKWEYKFYVPNTYTISDYYQRGMLDENVVLAEINKLGEEGWELVDVYTKVETVHPNFGNEKYVTGIQPNTRTSRIVYVFKRPLKEHTEKKAGSETDTVLDSAAVDSAVVDVWDSEDSNDSVAA